MCSFVVAMDNLIFRGTDLEVERVFELVQIRSWNWFTARLQGFHSSFFEWVSNPIQRLKSIKLAILDVVL